MNSLEMVKMKHVARISAAEAVAMIPDGATVATGGFVGCAHPEALTAAVEASFLAEGRPKGLTLVYAAGQGDGKTQGLNHFGHEGMLKRVIGGHWNLAPKMGALAMANKIEAYNFPQGVISHLFREIAAGNPGRITHVGLGTFVDPRHDGGKLNACTTEELVELLEIGGREWLCYKSFPLDIGLLRGTAADSFGNISFENEVITAESLSLAQAVHNSGGKVIVQVEKLVPDYSRDPKSIRIPGIYVDAVVVAGPEQHRQTYAELFNPRYVRQGAIDELELPPMEPGPRRWICARAFAEIAAGDIVNLGIGMPEGIALIAQERHRLDSLVLTVEAGPIGGVPAGGLSFGAANYPHAIIDQPYMFDFYDGGGLDVAFLGLAQADSHGNINVSKFSGRVAGIGGFMNITQNARTVVFTGTFTAGGLEAEFVDGKVRIVTEGRLHKFVETVEHITYSGQHGLRKGQKALFITERGVFRMTAEGLELFEIAPGIDLQTQIIDQMGFTPRIAPELTTMPAEIFSQVEGCAR